MIPGMNPRMMKQAMKRMGIQQQDIEATEVIIRTPDKDLVINNPQVAKVNMMGQETFQITGEVEERELSVKAEINEEDIGTVMAQTGVDEETAKKSIEENEGDLAAAIMSLKQ
ncbi:MAG: nascent polypeptide-associated complex protein [Nanoarchaeota archaeon]